MAAALGFRSPPLPWNLRSVPDARGLMPLRSSPSPPPLASGRLFFPLHMESCAPTLRSLASRCRCHGGGPERQWLEKRDESDQDEILEGEIVRTLLIDNYDSYTYNIYQELSVVNGVPPVVIRNDEWTWDYIYHCLYEKRAFDNIVISPGPGTPACPNDVSAYKYFMIAKIFQYWASALATRPWDWFMVLMLSMLLSRFMDVSVKSSMAIAIFSIKYLQELDLALRLFDTIHL